MASSKKLYDFYLMFHESDSEKAQEILEHFENQENGGFRGFYPDRDTISGTYLSSFSSALNQSRLVFIILSNDSIKSDWFKFQVQASLMDHVMKGTSRIIPVYLEYVDDFYMQLYIGVIYGSPDFWSRLRQAFG